MMQINGLGGKPLPSISDLQGMEALQNRCDVACVGEALYDCIALDESNGMTANQLLESGQFVKLPGGAPTNVACALKNLGVHSMFCGAMGDDKDGQELQQMLSSKGVETVLSVHENPTRRVMVTRDNQGERQFSGFAGGMKSSEYADCHYKPAVSSEWVANCASLAIVSGTLGLAYDGPTSIFIDKLARIMKSKPLTNKSPLFVVDMNVRNVFWDNPDMDEKEIRQAHVDFASQADIIKLTDEEAEWTLGIPPATALAQPELVTAALNARVGVLVTAGEKGAAFHIKGVGSGRSSGFDVTAIDTTGAGDAFTAGFLTGVSIDRDAALTTPEGAQRALVMGCAAGALTCTKIGAIEAQPTLQDILALMLDVKV